MLEAAGDRINAGGFSISCFGHHLGGSPYRLDLCWICLVEASLAVGCGGCLIVNSRVTDACPLALALPVPWHVEVELELKLELRLEGASGSTATGSGSLFKLCGSASALRQ